MLQDWDTLGFITCTQRQTEVEYKGAVILQKKVANIGKKIKNAQ